MMHAIIRRSGSSLRWKRCVSTGTGELIVELDNHVAKVGLNRPHRMNALSFDMGNALLRLNETLAEAGARAVVVYGMGNHAFSTGRDLKDSKDHTEEQAHKYMCLARDTVLAMRKSPLPTVAAVNGYAFGWGLELALACDLRVITSKATLCFPETSLGIFPGAMGTVLLPRLVGPAIAKELILTSRRFDGKEALRLGLATTVTDSSESCVQSAVELAQKIAQNAPLGVQAAKTVIDNGLDMSFEQHAALSDKHRFPLNHTEDFKEALAAFAQGRKPHFKGK